QDIDPRVFHARYVEVIAKNNGKVMPAGDGLDQKTTEDIINLVSVVLGGYSEISKKKTFTMTAVLQRALTWSEEAVVIIETSKAGLPNEICPTPLVGSLHPATLAGALVQGNAEILSGIVLNQIVNPGAPVMYMTWAGMMDMSSTLSNVFGCPEQVLLSAAFAQMAKFYEIPSNIITAFTDSKIPDQQCGYEKMTGLLLTALAKPDEIALVGGLLEGGKVANYEQLVIDNEIAGYVKRIIKGIDINDDKLALDIISETGPGGNYLSHTHTLKHFKDEQYFQKLSDRSTRQVWENAGSREITFKARETAAAILNEFKPNHLDNKIISELERETAKIYRREGVSYKPYMMK
ncbi:MAG: trimethylamine methyltransferase family protein, partial [Actinobacteria bacterium]|nr:trimethylamine methyltransferase family protein [Actinomycetota bacterium]